MTSSKKLLALSLLAIGLSALLYISRPQSDPNQGPEQAQALRQQWFKDSAQRPRYAPAEREPCAQQWPQRKAWFGGLHVHTGLSADAWAFDVRATPADAYRFAKGAAISLPPLDKNGIGTRWQQLQQPLDFLAVTDHAEHLGESSVCQNPEMPGYDSLLCRVYRGDHPLPLSETMAPLSRLAAMIINGRHHPSSICGEGADDCLSAAGNLWQQTQRAAEQAYDRSSACSFTSFVGYEYTLAEKAANLHRNIIFANAAVPPLPLSAKEAPEPAMLWQWLQDSCLESGSDCDALAIPHNSNWSSGRMFHPESISDNRSAALRERFETLVEVLQVKGDSECRNDLAGVLGSADEFCDFEKLRDPDEIVEDCPDGQQGGGMLLKGCLSRHNYARYGLIEGLAQQQQRGINPLRYGLIAATDTHNATAGAVDEANFMGSAGSDSRAELRLASRIDVPGNVASGSPVRFNPGGLAGVYAETNTREALFAAMQRRETFGTSGPRIQPRFFAGATLDPNICQRPDWLAQAGRQALPMGSVLPAQSHNRSPQFLAQASRDPSSIGAPLQRLQIIKGWMRDDGQMQQAVYDVAGALDNSASVDTESCERSGSGYAQLCTVWQDPDFDASQGAVYYLRVLENPSCRWSTQQCNSLPADQRPESCSDPAIPKTVQERAWTSPIWYYPDN